MISTRDIGYAAYAMMQSDSRFVSYDKTKREFIIETTIDNIELGAMYMNSDCRRHDSLVVHLKQLIIGG